MNELHSSTVTFDTALGRCAIRWSKAGITGVLLPKAGGRPGPSLEVGAVVPAFVGEAIEGIVAVMDGFKRDLSSIPLDERGIDDFRRAVYTETRDIPAGTTRSYGEVARAIGRPDGARDVGAALARNPFPILVPCHRVVAANGALTGFSAPGGLETTQRIRREYPATAVIVMAADEDEESLFASIKAGAAAFVIKDISPEDLILVIRRVSQGEFLINDKVFSKPAVASRVLKEFRELAVYGQEAQPIFAPLSPREVEILDNIAQGMTNKQVAYALSISEQTVKNHMSSILRKLSVNDRTQAVVYAMRQGWIRMPED